MKVERKMQNYAMQLAFEPRPSFQQRSSPYRNNAYDVSIIDDLYLSHRQVRDATDANIVTKVRYWK